MADTKIDKEYKVEVTGFTHEGKGVGRINNKVVFITEALPGEIVLCRVTNEKKKYMEAEIVDIIKSHPSRIVPACEVVKKCGGCNLQHVRYEKQLQLKNNLVDDALQKIGGLSEYEMKNIIGMDKPWGYRNKIVFQVRRVNNKMKLGFFKSGSRELVPYTSCALIDKDMQNVAEDVQSHLQIFDDLDFKLIQVLLRKSRAHGEILLGFITKGETKNFQTKLQEISQKLFEKHSSIKSVVQKHLAESDNTWGAKTDLLAGKEYITEQLKDIVYRVSAVSFFQVNSLQAEKLYEKIMEFSQIQENEIIWDIYCGTGSISLFLARKSKHVYGIESVDKAVQDAKINAHLNNISNVTFITGKAEQESVKLIEKGIKPDVIVVDPPRKGCHKEVINTILEVEPKRIIYVSCNPATLARDLQLLDSADFRVKTVQPIDMFPHTYHVETVCLLERK